MQVLGKVPLAELTNTLDSLKGGVYTIICDGSVTKDIVDAAEKAQVKHVIAMDARTSSNRVNIVTAEQL